MSRILHLVDQPGNRLKSPAELKAYVEGRLAARKKYTEQESERRAAEQAAWRKAQADKAVRRQNIQYFIFAVAYIVLVVGCLHLLWPR